MLAEEQKSPKTPMPTSKRRPEPLKAIVTRSGLGEIAEAARQHDVLTKSVKQALPADLRSGLVSANIRDRNLVLIAQNAAWATRLRFHGPEILTLVSPEQPALTGVVVRVLPQPPT